MDTITQTSKRQTNKSLFAILALVIICILLCWALGFLTPIPKQFLRLSLYFQPQQTTVPTSQANKQIIKSLAHATYANIPTTDLAIKLPDTTYHIHQLMHDPFLKVQGATVAFRDDYQQSLFDTQDCMKKTYAHASANKEVYLNEQFCTKLLAKGTTPPPISYEIDIIPTTETPENFIHANYITPGQTNSSEFPVGKLTPIGNHRLLTYTLDQSETVFFLPYANKHNQAVLILFRGDANTLTSFLSTIKQS